jgi:hypothetical protein
MTTKSTKLWQYMNGEIRQRSRSNAPKNGQTLSSCASCPSWWLTPVAVVSNWRTSAQSLGLLQKEFDKDVVYDETRLPAYELPQLLVSSEGKRITTAEAWLAIRRPQIMSLFGNLPSERSVPATGADRPGE